MNDSVEKENVKVRISTIAVLIICAMIVGAGFIGLVRTYGKTVIYDSRLPRNDDNIPKELSQKWRKAVMAGDSKNAILYASQIVPAQDFEMPTNVYLDFFEMCGHKLNTLTETWNEQDFQRWKSIFDAKMTASKITTIEALYDAIEKNAGSRIIFDIAYQAGYDPLVVRVVNKEKKSFIEMYEFRTPDYVFSFDPASKKIVKSSVKEYVPAGSGLLYLYPAELADYRRFNRLLFKRVAPALGKMPPDPAEMLGVLKEKYPDSDPENREIIAFWPIPVVKNTVAAKAAPASLPAAAAPKTEK